MSQPENAWAIAEELMSQNMLDVPIHIAAPVIAKVLASRTPAASNTKGQPAENTVERLAEEFHNAYQAEARRQGDVRHKDAYADLPENIKEFDRVLARHVLARGVSEYERGRRDTFEEVRLYFQQSFMYDEKLTIERFCGFIAKLAATSGTPAPRAEIFSKANRLAKATNQVVGEKHDLYVTLEQLMEIL